MLTSTPTVLLTTRKRLCEVSFLGGKEDPGMLIMGNESTKVKFLGILGCADTPGKGETKSDFWDAHIPLGLRGVL